MTDDTLSPSPEVERRAWLIERRVDPPQWSSRPAPTGIGAFYTDVNSAHRFPTHAEAAEAMRRMSITPEERGQFFVAEHVWMAEADEARELARADKDRRIEIALKMLVARWPVVIGLSLRSQTDIVNAMEDFAQALAALEREQLLAAEQRVLTAETRAERLRRLIPLPDERGGYVGDTFYPVGGTEASHRWDGQAWQWLPELLAADVDDDEALSPPLPSLEVERLRKALEPFAAVAKEADDFDPEWSDLLTMNGVDLDHMITLGHCRAARDALASHGRPSEGAVA